jgi:hypothetical protein
MSLTRPPSALLAILAVAGCAPRARPLAGAPTPARLPRAELPRRPEQIVFKWRYAEQGGFSARGEGVARTTSPDSARLDFFLDGGFGRGFAILTGNDLVTPGPDFVRRFIPPVPMLWGALGRLSVPPAADTTARVSGDTLRADVGRDPVWRVTFVGDRLVRLERIDGGRLIEWVTRSPEGALRYHHETERRGLSLDIVRVEPTASHDPSIWRR